MAGWNSRPNITPSRGIPGIISFFYTGNLGYYLDHFNMAYLSHDKGFIGRA